MQFIFSTPVLIRYLWQLKTVVYLHWCPICAVLLYESTINLFHDHNKFCTVTNQRFCHSQSLPSQSHIWFQWQVPMLGLSSISKLQSLQQICDLQLDLKCPNEIDRCAILITEAITLATSFILLVALHFCYVFMLIC